MLATDNTVIQSIRRHFLVANRKGFISICVHLIGCTSSCFSIVIFDNDSSCIESIISHSFPSGQVNLKKSFNDKFANRLLLSLSDMRSSLSTQFLLPPSLLNSSRHQASSIEGRNLRLTLVHFYMRVPSFNRVERFQVPRAQDYGSVNGFDDVETLALALSHQELQHRIWR